MCPDSTVSGPITIMQTHTIRNITEISFGIPELIPYINWIYFYHAWSIREEQGLDLRQEATVLLDQWAAEGRQTVFRVRLLKANSHEDDILLYGDDIVTAGQAVPVTAQDSPLHVLPLLRQQRKPFLCLADFLPPIGKESNTIGIFASSAPFHVESLLEQTVADRLSEATAELGHEMVRKHIWGYAPDENLSPKDLFAEHYTGKRPAIGYPSMPDLSLNFLLKDILDFQSMGITLTENGAMVPHASTSGLMLCHPRCMHFSIGNIGEDQLQDYARRRNMNAETLKKFLNVI